ncbi:MAG TPA: phosphatase PAP2 family protein [Anaerolineales bacterium]
MATIDAVDSASSAPRRVLGRYPLIGLVLALLGGLFFSTLAINVRDNGPLTREDVPVSQDLHRVAEGDPAPTVNFIHGSSFYLGREFIEVSAVLLGLYWLIKRRWSELAMLAIGLGGGSAWWFFFERLYNRPRPNFPDPIETLNVGSFPSGHGISAVLFFGLLAYLIVPRLKSGAARAAVILAALALILYVGFGRLYVGGHFLTDVLAGYALGLGWGALVYTAVELVSRRRV